MELVNKKQRGCETLSYPPEAVEEITELRRALQERDAALEESQVEVARLRAEVSQLRGEMIECHEKAVAPDLPSEIWAHILELSWYYEWQQYLGPPYTRHTALRTLYIDSERAFMPQQAPRFRADNVIEVVMDYTFTFQDPVGRRPGRFGVMPCFETGVGARSVSHFLGCFSNLRHVFIGKGERETKGGGGVYFAVSVWRETR
jgi:hypothetical protein